MSYAAASRRSTSGAAMKWMSKLAERGCRQELSSRASHNRCELVDLMKQCKRIREWEGQYHSTVHIARYKSQKAILQCILNEKGEIEAISGLDTETS